MIVKPSVRSPNTNGTCVQWNSSRSSSCNKIGLRLDAFPGGVIAVGHREVYRLLRRGDETYWGIENKWTLRLGGILQEGASFALKGFAVRVSL